MNHERSLPRARAAWRPLAALALSIAASTLVGPAASALECDFVTDTFRLALLEEAGPSEAIGSLREFTVVRNGQSDVVTLCFVLDDDTHCVDAPARNDSK